MQKSEHTFREMAVVVLLLITLLVGCGDREDESLLTTSEPAGTAVELTPESTSAAALPSPTTADSGAYPYPVATATATVTESGDGYPPPPPPTLTPITSYPAATATPIGTVLAFDRPLAAGDTMVSGVGPAGLEVTIRNVTFMNEELATTTIDEEGRFEATVTPLPAGVRVGLTADVEASGITETVLPAEGAVNVPQIGYFYDSFVIPSE